MNIIASQQAYPAPSSQPQEPTNNEAVYSPLAPYVAKVPGGEAAFQPIPSFQFSPRTSAFISAGFTPIPGVNVGVTKTVRFGPVITLSPNDKGGISASFRPNIQFEVSGTGSLSVPNILGTGLGANGGAGFTKRLTLGGPEFSANIDPDGTFKLSAGIAPTFTTTQTANVNGGVQGSVAGIGGGLSQTLAQETSQTIRFGGAGVEYTGFTNRDPQVSFNHDKTVSITNRYTFAPRTSATANFQAGPLQVNAGAGVAPTFTAQHTVTFSTDTSKFTPPKHDFSVAPGIRVDGSVGFRVSLLPPGFPVSLNVGVNANPVLASTAGRVQYVV